MKTIKYSTRHSAIEKILQFNKDAFIISSVGLTSRALYEVKDSPNHFYMMGSMGCALGFAIGLALNTNKEVVAILGDAEIIMGYPTLMLTEYLKLPNLSIYILDNNQHQSTGGQKTISKNLPKCGHNVWTINIKDNHIPKRIPLTHNFISKRFYNAINGLQ